jgi:hypothetical protein
MSYPKFAHILLLFSIVALIAWGCTHARPRVPATAEIISTTLTMASYTNARMPETNLPTKQFYFPTLEVYSGAGILVYVSHDAYRNSRTLEELSEGSFLRVSNSNSAPLSQVVTDIPAFNSRRAEILARHMPAVISISLDECGGCQVQDAALVLQL